jgi:hypothetical protein
VIAPTTVFEAQKTRKFQKKPSYLRIIDISGEFLVQM